MQTAPPQGQPGPTGPRQPKKCRCGHTIGHAQVHPEPKYSVFGWFLLLMGATPNPLYAVYRCGRCETALGATKDPAILKEFTA